MLDFEALVYFKGNLIHVFLIHFHLTHQNVALEKLFEILVSYFFFPPNFSLLMTYFPNSRKPIFPKASGALCRFEFGSKVRKGTGREHSTLPLSTSTHRLQLTSPGLGLPVSPAPALGLRAQGEVGVAFHKWTSFSKIALHSNKYFCHSMLMPV